ncbi:hypothetical protein ABBQ38_000642 [Trebouxia sp. C0009 RCD-2024]
MDLRIHATPKSGMWGLFRSVCDKLEGQRPIIEGAMDSNAGGVVAGSVHQLMQSDQVILVSAGCLQLFTTITATAPDRDRGRVFEAEPGLRDRLAALQAY